MHQLFQGNFVEIVKISPTLPLLLKQYFKNKNIIVEENQSSLLFKFGILFAISSLIYSDCLNKYLRNRGLICSLHHKGRTSYSKNYQEKRNSHTIHKYPESTNQHLEIGYWEVDTVAGKIDKKLSKLVKYKIIELFQRIEATKVKTITPDRGKEFSNHSEVTE